MYVSPNHPDREKLLARQRQPEQQADPEPSGRLLASFPRRGEGGVEQELRVVLDEFKGHEYLAIRLWQKDSRSGQWWPLKGKGVSIRIAEAEGVAEALQEVAEGTSTARRRGVGA